MTDFRVTLTSTGRTLALGLCRNVTNAAEIRSLVMSGQLDCAVVKAALVVDPLQLVVAANKVFYIQMLDVRLQMVDVRLVEYV